MPYELWEGNNYQISYCQVIDGDTINAEVSDDYPTGELHRIRLHGIDAPELSQPYGPDAAQYLLNLVQTDPRPLYAYVTDAADLYGRTVAILHHGNPADSVNAQLVWAGMAYARYANDYRETERSAQQSRIGVWQQNRGGTRPWDYRRGRTRSPGCFGTIMAMLAIAAFYVLLTLL